jgi:hypothetical protein
MLLVPALALSAFGLLVWAIGLQMGYKGIAVIGAVLVVGVGVAVLDSGLQQRAGTVENSVNSSTTEISVQTEPVPLTSAFNTGLIWSLLGGVLVLQALSYETA